MDGHSHSQHSDQHGMNWRRHANKLVDTLTDVLSGAAGAFFYHFLTEKKDKEGHVVVTDGKPVMTLDPAKMKAHAPYAVMDLTDEAEFNGLLAHLDPGSRKNLVAQMGPVQFGPVRPGEVLPGLGKHQRADVILTMVQLLCREGTPKDEARREALVMLQSLADIEDPGEWKRQAVAFKLMKENERDYLGAWFSQESTEVLREVWQEIQNAYRQGAEAARQWAEDLDAGTEVILQDLEVRSQFGIIRGFFSSFARALALPWETSGRTVARRPNRQNPRANNNHGRADSNSNRSQIGLAGCLRLDFDLNGYRQYAASRGLNTEEAGA